MTKIKKLKEKFFQKPESLKYKDIELVLKYLGFEKINAKGSHVKFKHSKMEFDIIFPIHNGDCKNFYKKNCSKRVKKIKL